ncbi:MAG TPA: ribosome biogenesis GTP-binding protein YihA/YsxC [Gammaproteobacteria bacterium]
MNPIYFKACYSGSAYSLEQLPPDTGIELAFAGRSNAGKSSAINVITRNQGLARVSRTPGRTQMINHFRIDQSRSLVDLPGYGYAKVPHKTRQHWQQTLAQYLATRDSLQGVILVMDIRHPLQDSDWQMIEWCTNAELGLHILLTKADKLARNTADKNLRDTAAAVEKAGIHASLQLFSAHDKSGLDDAHSLLDEWFGFGSGEN